MTDDDFNTILNEIGASERANARLMDALYTELHGIAARLMKGERETHTLQATALVHEAFLRLVDSEKIGEKGHLHFLDAAAVTMRRVLVDHARAARAAKRGGTEKRERITLRAIMDDVPDGAEEEVDFAALDKALEALGRFNSRHAKIVELRFFSGMSGEQIAELLGITRSTVVRNLAFSRAWLQQHISKQSSE